MNSKTNFPPIYKSKAEDELYDVDDKQYEHDLEYRRYKSTIRAILSLYHQYCCSSAEEKLNLNFKESLNELSVLHLLNLKKIYGSGRKTQKIMTNLQNNPMKMIPLILDRIVQKYAELQDNYKKKLYFWKSQRRRYYAKSLDVRSANFKKEDAKALQPKNLIQEIETLYEKSITLDNIGKPHITKHFSLDVFEDAFALIRKHLRQQATSNNGRGADLLLLDIATFFGVPYKLDCKNNGTEIENTTSPSDLNLAPGATKREEKLEMKKGALNAMFLEEDSKCLFLVNNNWYIFFHLFHVLCDRLSILKKQPHQEKFFSEKIFENDGNQNHETIVSDFSSPYDELKYLLTEKARPNIQKGKGRELFGIFGYLCLTLDQNIKNIAKLVIRISGKDTYDQYQNKAQQACFKVVWHEDKAQLQIKLLAQPSYSGNSTSSRVLLSRNLKKQIRFWWQKNIFWEQQIIANKNVDERENFELHPEDYVVVEDTEDESIQTYADDNMECDKQFVIVDETEGDEDMNVDYSVALDTGIDSVVTLKDNVFKRKCCDARNPFALPQEADLDICLKLAIKSCIQKTAIYEVDLDCDDNNFLYRLNSLRRAREALLKIQQKTTNSAFQ